MIRSLTILIASCAASFAATMTFSWVSVPGAASYRLLRGPTAETATNLHATAATNSVTVTNVPTGNYWRVVALNEIGMESPASDAILLRLGVVRVGTARANTINVR